jgi:hypothetical protein
MKTSARVFTIRASTGGYYSRVDESGWPPGTLEYAFLFTSRKRAEDTLKRAYHDHLTYFTASDPQRVVTFEVVELELTVV